MTTENIDVLNNLLNIAGKYSLTDIEKNLNNIAADKIPIRAAFLGEFNAGKTTIVNAIIQRKLLPAFEVPTTALITEISAAGEDQAFLITLDDNGQEISTPIGFDELSDYITGTDPTKKVFVGLKDLSFLSDNLLLIDTPGIASLNETHSDITYGYLPAVDVAFVIINPNSGDLPKTMIDFLAQFPKDLLEKIYFVISRADQFPPNALNEVVEKVTASLGAIMDEPKVSCVSGQEAVDALGPEGIADEQLYISSGIGGLRQILEKRIPLQMQELEEKRVMEVLLLEKDRLLGLLETKLASLSWTPGDLQASILQYREEIASLEQQIDDFKKSFKSLKADTANQVRAVVKDFTGLIGYRLSKAEPYDDLVQSMVFEVRQAIEIGMERLKTIEFSGLGDHHPVNIAAILKTLIEKETSAIRDIANIVTDAATFALTVWVVPGSSASINAGEAIAGGGVLIAQEAEQIFNTESTGKKGVLKNFGQIAGTVGRMVKDLNPLEKVKSAILPYLLNPRLSQALNSRLTVTLNNIFDLIGNELNRELKDKYLQPLKDKEALLEAAERAKRQQRSDTGSSQESLQSDILVLKGLS